MGAACISQTQHENKGSISVNTDTPNPSVPTTPTTDLVHNNTSINNKNNAKTVQSVNKQIQSEPYQISPNPSKHVNRNKNSLGSIDEYSAITDIRSNEFIVDSDQYQSIGPLLTHEALREHDNQMNYNGIGIESVSISSISDTDIDDDTLKQIGNQLLAMNINKKTSISIVSSDKNNGNIILERKQSSTHHLKDCNTMKPKSNNKYKQYKPREFAYSKSKSNQYQINDDNKSQYSRKDNKSQYSRQSSSIWSLSETPQPKEFRIGADDQSREPEYHRMQSDSRHHHQHHNHHNHHRCHYHQKTKTDGKNKYLNHLRESEEEETETDGTSDIETSMQFPDVYYFDNNNKQRRKNTRNNFSSFR